MNYTVESLPPEYKPGTSLYLDSIRQLHNIPDEAQGQDVRNQVQIIWQKSLTSDDGFSDRVQLMEILMGERVGGQDIGSLGYLILHLHEPETFEKFLGGVANAKGWLEEDRAAATKV